WRLSPSISTRSQVSVTAVACNTSAPRLSAPPLRGAVSDAVAGNEAASEAPGLVRPGLGSPRTAGAGEVGRTTETAPEGSGRDTTGITAPGVSGDFSACPGNTVGKDATGLRVGSPRRNSWSTRPVITPNTARNTPRRMSCRRWNDGVGVGTGRGAASGGSGARCNDR